MIWHERTDSDPGARVFRTVVADAVGVSRRPFPQFGTSASSN